MSLNNFTNVSIEEVKAYMDADEKIIEFMNLPEDSLDSDAAMVLRMVGAGAQFVFNA